MNTLNTNNPLAVIRAMQPATLAAQTRTGIKGLSVRVKQGKCQIVNVEYDDKGDSTVTPLSDWVPVANIIDVLSTFGVAA